MIPTNSIRPQPPADRSPHAVKTAKIKLTGKYGDDFKAGDKAAGITEQWRLERNLVWHHSHKMGTMELVPTALNNPALGGMGHAGGVKLYELIYQTTYGK